MRRFQAVKPGAMELSRDLGPGLLRASVGRLMCLIRRPWLVHASDTGGGRSTDPAGLSGSGVVARGPVVYVEHRRGGAAVGEGAGARGTPMQASNDRASGMSAGLPIPLRVLPPPPTIMRRRQGRAVGLGFCRRGADFARCEFARSLMSLTRFRRMRPLTEALCACSRRRAAGGIDRRAGIVRVEGDDDRRVVDRALPDLLRDQRVGGPDSTVHLRSMRSAVGGNRCSSCSSMASRAVSQFTTFSMQQVCKSRRACRYGSVLPPSR